MARTNTMPVVMYPEGSLIGRVRSGRDPRSGKIRHVALRQDGYRVGTFDSFREAHDGLIAHVRQYGSEAYPITR